MRIADIVEALDANGCTGLTIWINHLKHVQVSLTRDKVSWTIEVDPRAEVALTKAVEAFNEETKPHQRKQRVPIIKRRRDNSDLV